MSNNKTNNRIQFLCTEGRLEPRNQKVHWIPGIIVTHTHTHTHTHAQATN